MENVPQVDYQTLPVDSFTIVDLTDALGIDKSAALFNASRRYIYTIRNTNTLSLGRLLVLIDEVKKNEAACRRRLTLLRKLQRERAARVAD